MKPLAIAIGALLAIAIAWSAAQNLAKAITGPTRAEIAADIAQAERIELDAALYAQWQPVTTAVQHIVLYTALIGLVAFLGTMGVLSTRRYHYERVPDRRGLLPVLASDQHTAQLALQLYHAAQIEEARRAIVPTVPSSLVYSPHVSYEEEHGAVNVAGALPEPVSAARAGVPTFAQLLDAGRVGPGNPLLLGYDRETGAPVEGSWLDLYSCAVGGVSGSGKTWTAAFLAAQAALHGARLVVLDPHADNPESLASRLAPMSDCYVCEVADTPKTMLQSVDLVAGELERRRGGGRGEPWLFVVDEFSALQRGELAEPLAHLVEALGQEGRKMALYGMVCGQIWTASRAGGTELRDSLASAYIHRLRPAQARMLTGLTSADLPSDLINLPAGTAYLLSTSGDLRAVGIPQASTRDIQRVAELASGKPDGSLMEAKTVQASRSSIRPEAARALQLFREGLDLAQIVKELRNVETTTGRKYQEAAREVQRLLREALA